MRKTSFYYSFLVLPKPKRDVIVAVWDLCRAVDDAVDLEPDETKARAALDGWRDEIARVYAGGEARTPQGRTLQPFVLPHHLPREQFEALIDGVAMDVAPRRYDTFEDLEPYCHRVASSVGLICAEIFGYRDPGVLDYARDLGVALQLTNILRDVAVDYPRGRMYLPLEDLRYFRCDEAMIAREVAHSNSPEQSEAVRAVLRFQAARAHVYFARAVRALPPQELRAVVAAEIMRRIYQELLVRIEAANCDVFDGVVRVPGAARARVAFSTWWAIRLGGLLRH